MNQKPSKFLYFSNIWPKQNYNTRSNRIEAFIRLIHRSLLNPVFSSSAARPKLDSDVIRQYSFASCVNLDPNKVDNIEHFLKKQDASLTKFALFDGFQSEEQYSVHVHKHMPNLLKVLDLQKMVSLQSFRRSLLDHAMNDLGDSSQLLDKLKVTSALHGLPTLENMLHAREMASIFRSDLIIVSSDFEQMILEKNYGLKNVVKAQMVFDQLPYEDDNEGYNLYFFDSIRSQKHYNFEKRKNFVWVGNLSDEANQFNLEMLVNYMWPEISKELKDAELHIYAHNCPKKIQNLIESQTRVKLIQSNTDLKFLMKYRAMIEPTFVGSGIRGKFACAWDNFLPVATTIAGAEGLFHESIDNDFWVDRISQPKADPRFFKPENEILKSSNNDILNYYQYKDDCLDIAKDKLTFGGLFAANSILIRWKTVH